MEYREVTDKLLAMDANMKDQARQIYEDYAKKKHEACDVFYNELKEVVSGWSKDDFDQWCRNACDDDTIAANYYNIICMTWIIAHPDDIRVAIAVPVEVDAGEHGHATKDEFMQVLGMLADIYADMHG